MKLQQLSLFLENKPGQLRAPCQALATAGLNIVTLSMADTEQFGILRLIIQEWKRAKEVLEAAGHVVNVTDVIAVEVPDRPGGLGELLEKIDKCGLSIEYMYAFTQRRRDSAVMIFRFDDVDAAIAGLQREGVNVIGGVDLFQ